MRYAILFIFQSEGLRHHGLAQVVVGDKTPTELQVMLGALFAELPIDADEADVKAVQDLVKEIKELTEERSVVIHSVWLLAEKAACAESYGTNIRPRPKQEKGAVSEAQDTLTQSLRQLTGRAEALQMKPQRLQYVLLHDGFKVATELAKLL